jgi:hypothetical protein
MGASLFAYSNTLSGQFIYDDKEIIVKNPLIRRLDQIPLLFGTSYWRTNIGEPKTAQGGLYRPLTMVTFALNYALGKLNPAGYHAVNLLLHIGVVLVLWRLGLRFWMTPPAAGAAALLFAVLPVHVEAVSSVVGRSDVLAAFFVLLAWFLVMRSSEWGPVCLGGACFTLALFSKDSAAALLPVLIVSDLALSSKTYKETVPERTRVWIVYGGVLFLYLEWRSLILGKVLSVGAVPYFTSQSGLVVLLTMSKFVFQHYLKPLVLGIGFCVDYTRPSLPDVGLRDPAGWLCAMVLIGSIGYAFYSAVAYRSRMALCVLIFFALLSPVMNVVARLEVIGAERFLYLPSIGFCLALGLLFEQVRVGQAPHLLGSYLLLVVLCLWYGWNTFERNKVWQTEESMWQTTVLDAPNSPRSWNGLGIVLMNQNRYDYALRDFKKALSLNPMVLDAYRNIAECYFYKGDYLQSKQVFSALHRVIPYDRDVLLYLAALHEKEQDFRSAALTYATLLQLNPFDRTVLKNFALMRCRTANSHICRSELENYLRGALPEEHNEDILRFLSQLPA